MRMHEWTADYLASMRLVADPLADEVIAQVYRRGDRAAVNELWLQLLQNDQIPKLAACPEVVQYLENSSRLPDWARPKSILIGERLFMEHGLYALVSLLCASLPECYVMKNGVHVLWATQKLEAHTYRRLYETAQMVVDVMSAGGLAAGGKGVMAAQKVRLMHAAIRHLILQTPPPDAAGHAPTGFAQILATLNWDTERLGLPINQEDMAYTLLTFSYVIPRAMERLGAAITADQKEAYLHCWNIVGYVMGVREELLPANVAEAASLFALIQQTQGGASEAGQALTAAVVRCVEEQLPEGWMRRLPRLVVRQLVGPANAKVLGLPQPSGLDRMVMGFMWVTERVAEGLWRRLVGKASRKIGEALVKRITAIPRGWQRKLFDLPDHLATSWGIPQTKN